MTSTATQVEAHGSPDLTPADREGMEELWRIYDANYEEVSKEAERVLADDPESAPCCGAFLPKWPNSRTATPGRCSAEP